MTEHVYSITIEGNDLDAKAAGKLKAGDALVLERLADEEDTFDIVVKTLDGKELDILDYPASLGIAPFLDREELKIAYCEVEDVILKKGRTNASNSTTVRFRVGFEDGGTLEHYLSGDGRLLFFRSSDRVLDLARQHLLATGRLMDRPYLNLFEIKTEDSRHLSVFFSEDFSRCRVSLEENGEKKELTEDEYGSAISLVNHRRILIDDEDPVDPQIDE